MKKLILFGDSNTYGYDPRDFLGGRYPENVRWATKVRNELAEEFEVIEDGQNGRSLPSVNSLFFKGLVAQCSYEDYLVMMLGTNDILLVNNPDIKAPVMRMDQILSYVAEYGLRWSALLSGGTPDIR